MVEGDLDFSCIEAIMIMFPSILWLDMMKMGTEYTKKKVMNGFLCRPTQGTFHRVCQTANVLCDSLPTWQDFVGIVFSERDRKVCAKSDQNIKNSSTVSTQVPVGN